MISLKNFKLLFTYTLELVFVTNWPEPNFDSEVKKCGLKYKVVVKVAAGL